MTTAEVGMSRLRRWVRTTLDPADALCEVTCGLVMTLTIVLTAGLIVGDSDDPARLLLATAVGCNLAWGIIDGLLYVMSGLYERSARRQLVLRVRSAPRAEGIEAIRTRVVSALGDILDDDAVDTVTAAAYGRASTTDLDSITVARADWRVVAASVVCNMVAIVPAVVPFVVVDDWRVALRLSNVLLVATLAGVGWAWGRAAGLQPARSSVTLVVIGLTMVVVAAALGG